MKSLDELDHYEVLEVPREASREEIERAHALVRAAYEGDSLAAYSVFAPDEAKLWRERIDLAWRVLGDADSRRAYDASLDAADAVHQSAAAQVPLAFAGDEAEEDDDAVAEAVGLAVRPEPAPIPEEPVPEPPSALPRELAAFDEAEEDEDAPWGGARLRRSRVVRGLEIDDVARVTKINPTYLRFLEEERFDDLPAVVYVRGFVAAYARHLGLDAGRVSRSYVSRCEEHRSSLGHGRLLGRR